jgi:hypothetical protein
MKLQALFYPLHLAQTQLISLVHGFELPAVVLNAVSFPEVAPRTQDRELAVPFLAGMDDIEVTAARIALRTVSALVDTEDFAVSSNGSQGVFLSLPTAARLKKVELQYTKPALPAPPLVQRVVVRAANRSGASFGAGVPLFADPPFPKPGPMFPEVLSGMHVSELGGDRQLLNLPSVRGDAWLIQVANATSTTDLAPVAAVPSVKRVTLDAAPRNLSVVLLGVDGTVELWRNPEALLPDVGEQEVSFTPLAQKELSAALARHNEAGDAPLTLPVRLRFDADSAGTISITDQTLTAVYAVRPVGADPLPLRLTGSAVPLTLLAPSGLTPFSSELKLSVKHLGRELNDASREPPITPPASGLRVDAERQVAAEVNVAPRAGEAIGTVLQLASARVYLATRDAAEAVLEIRGDVAGSPGPVVAPQVVRQIDAGISDWIEFELDKPLDVVAGQAPLWLSLRVTKGDVRWFMSTDTNGPARISKDHGQTWSLPDSRLQSVGSLLTQLFHVIVGVPAMPAIRLQDGATTLIANIPLSRLRDSTTEWVANTALSPQVHSLLAARAGQGKVATGLQLFSRSALDVVVQGLVLRYDPFTAGQPAAG